MSDGETQKERLDRELIELLNEVRVALPGVQVLFAFLLAVPFQQRFADTTNFQRDVYFAALSLALIATALLIAPTALHRLNFRAHDKQAIVLISNQLVIAGTLVLALAMTAVMVLISDVIFSLAMTIAVGVLSALVFLLLWLVLPLSRRVRN
jgi:predicted neutral ceramidase superfamily lipid hydrolase